jgi:hypothetical protein
VALGLEAFCTSQLVHGARERALEFRRGCDVYDSAAVDANKVMVMLGQVFGQFETSELVAGGNPSYEPGHL